MSSVVKDDTMEKVQSDLGESGSEYDSENEDYFMPESEFRWNTRTELTLLYCLSTKPVGISRHFVMAYIHHKFTTALKVKLSAQVIWDHLETLWDMQALEEMHKRDIEETRLLERVVDFGLPLDDYGELMAKKCNVEPSYVRLERLPDDVLAKYIDKCPSPVAKKKKTSDSSSDIDYMELSQIAGPSSMNYEDYILPAKYCSIAEKCVAASIHLEKKMIENYGNELSFSPCVVIEKDLNFLLAGTGICLSSHDAEILKNCFSEVMKSDEVQNLVKICQENQEMFLPRVLLEKNLCSEIEKAKVQVPSDVKALLNMSSFAGEKQVDMGNNTICDDTILPCCSKDVNLEDDENFLFTEGGDFHSYEASFYCQDSFDEESLNSKDEDDEALDQSTTPA